MGIWVGRYAMVGGEVHEHGPWLVDRVRTREDERVRLLVLAEPVDQRSSEFCNEIAEAVAALFGRESLSITGGLLRALQQAHANLAEWNRRSLREHRVAVGLTCVAIRENEATIAQVGPGHAYVDSRGGLTRLSTEGLPAERPLGSPEPIEPAFTSSPVVDHEILLASSVVERELGAAAIGEVLSAGPERALAELFVRTRELRDMTAALIADLDIDEEQPPPIEGSRNAGDLDHEIEGREVTLAAFDPASREFREARPPREPDEPTSQSRGTPVVTLATVGGRPVREVDRHEGDRREADRREVDRRDGETLPGYEADGSLGGGANGAHEAEPRRFGARAAAHRDAFPALRRPSRTVGRRDLRTGAADLPWRWIAIVGAAVVALALLAWAVVPGLLSEDRAATLQSAIASAEGYLSQAEQSDTITQQREALEAALVNVEQARSIAPEDPRVTELQAEAQASLDRLDAVTEVEDLQTVLGFDGTITAPVTAAALSAGGGSLWLVDEAQGRVFRVDPAAETEPVEVYRSGDRYGEADAADPVTLTWDETEGRLLVLDASRTLFAIDGQSPGRAAGPDSRPQPLPLRDAAALDSVAAMEAYRGNLYVLDPAGGEVWRYLPTGDGFDSERSGLLGGIDGLQEATDLTIDGDVYVLDGERLRRFREGREQPALLQGIDELPETPVALVEDELRGLFYVADRGQRRIVTGVRDGAFVRQYRHPDFFDLRGLAIAPDGGTLYVLTSDGILAYVPIEAS